MLKNASFSGIPMKPTEKKTKSLNPLSNLLAELGDLGLDALHLLLLGELASTELEGLLLVLGLVLLGLGTLDLLEWVGADGVVNLLVEILESLSLNIIIDVTLELGLVALLIVIGEGLHVLSDVSTEDVLAEGLSVELLGLHVVTWEAVLGVWNQDTSVGGTLHGTEDAGTGGGAGKSNIKEGLEWAAGTLVLSGLGEGELSVSLGDTLELLVHAELLENTAGDQETSAVSGGPVGKTVLKTVSLQLVGVGRGEDLVAGDLRGDDLHDDIAVGETDDEAVLWSIVLVLGLGDEALASIVVGLSGTTALVLSLIATKREVSMQSSKGAGRIGLYLTCSTQSS